MKRYRPKIYSFGASIVKRYRPKNAKILTVLRKKSRFHCKKGQKEIKYHPSQLINFYMADQAQPQGQQPQTTGQDPQNVAQPQGAQPTTSAQDSTQTAGAQPQGQQPQTTGQDSQTAAQPQGAPVPPQMDPNMMYQQMPPQGYSYPQGVPPQGMPPMGYGQPGMYPPQGMPPMGYGQPGMYPPQGYPQPGMPGAGMPPAEPEDTTPANFQLGSKLPRELKVKCPPSALKFDEDKFIKLLAGSISLSKDEKKKIVESVPKLKIEQIEELIRIFEEEKEKFAALSKKHVPQLEKLAEQHYQEWMQLEAEFEGEQKKQADKQKAEEIRKNLGI